MSVSYDKFRFATAPRTGTTWFLEACESAGLGKQNKAKAHIPFTEAEKNSFKLSVVRHPYEWLVSYFLAIVPGSIGVPEVDKLRFDDSAPPSISRVDDFYRFIRNYLDTCPGQVGRMFASYGADSYLRLEDMPWAASEFLQSMGLPPWKYNRCRYIDPVNVSKLHIPKDQDLYRSVMEAEKEMTEHYGYF